MDKPVFEIGGAQVIFQYLAITFGLKTFIETGTGFGDMLAFVQPVFDQLYSIESFEWNYKLAYQLLQNVKKIHLIFGDSAVELPKLLRNTPATPTLFWLDAHGIPGKEDGPLKTEIEAVIQNRPDSIIAIDDVGQGTHHDVVLSSIGNTWDLLSRQGWKSDYRFNRIMFLSKNYTIPAF